MLYETTVTELTAASWMLEPSGEAGSDDPEYFYMDKIFEKYYAVKSYCDKLVL